MARTKKIPIDKHRVVFLVYCNDEDADFIKKSLKHLGITHGRSGFFVQSVLCRLAGLGYTKSDTSNCKVSKCAK